MYSADKNVSSVCFCSFVRTKENFFSFLFSAVSRTRDVLKKARTNLEVSFLQLNLSWIM